MGHPAGTIGGNDTMMQLLADPNVAYLILVGGLWATALAVVAPGTGLLELVAVACLVLSGLALVVLPVNLWGVALVLLGVIPFGLAFLWPAALLRTALLLSLSAVLLSTGSAFLFRPVGTLSEGVSPWLAVGVSLITIAYFWIAIGKVIAARRAPALQDPAALVGKIGEARTDLDPQGTVYLAGELWTARADQPLPAGTRVRVVAEQGLLLKVTRAG